MVLSLTAPKPLSPSTFFFHHNSQAIKGKIKIKASSTSSSSNSSSSSSNSSRIILPGSSSNPNPQKTPTPLILPNQNQNQNQNQSQSPSPSPPRKLIIPSNQRSTNDIPTAHPSLLSLQPQNLYQPYRPPTDPRSERYRDLDTAGRIEILANRLGIWFEYAPLISALFQDGFTPPALEELTGITGVEQNRLVVASQVRQSLADELEPEHLAYFDSGGAEILYEIRLLSATQRTASARYIVEYRLDGRGARDLARAIKDYPMRRGDPGWDSFDYYLPGDCLSFMYFRQAREHKDGPWSPKWKASLELAAEVAVSERARERVLEELEGKTKAEEEGGGGEGLASSVIKVPVVRLEAGEVARASSVVVLPVCDVGDGDVGEEGILEAPYELQSQGEFGVVTADKGWKRWVSLPGWEPMLKIVGRGGVVVAFPSARVLPWRIKDRSYDNEPILVVIERESKEVTLDDGFYLVAVPPKPAETPFKVDRGERLKEMGFNHSLGRVVLVVRPPMDDSIIDDQLMDED